MLRLMYLKVKLPSYRQPKLRVVKREMRSISLDILEKALSAEFSVG